MARFATLYLPRVSPLSQHSMRSIFEIQPSCSPITWICSPRIIMKSSRLAQSFSRQVCVHAQARTYSVVHDVPQSVGPFAQSPVPAPPQGQSSLLEQAANATAPRNNWTKEEISEIHQTPLMELAFAAVCNPKIAWKPLTDTQA